MQNFEAFERGLQSMVRPPVLVFVGSELFLARRGVSLLAKKMGGDCHVSYFDCLRPGDGGTDAGAAVFGCLYNATFLGGTRLAVVENAHGLLRDEAARLTEFAARPPRGAYLCVAATGESRRLAFVAKSPRGVVVVNCDPPPRAAELRPWLEYWARRAAAEQGKKISDRALRLLLERTTGNLGDIFAQIQKISTYIGSREIISPADIEKLVTDESERTAFQLGNAALAGKTGAALGFMRLLIAAGAPAEHVLGGLVWQLHAIRKSFDALKRPRDSVRSDLQGAGTRDSDRYARQVAGLSRARLGQAFAAAYEADRAIKTGTMEPETALELLTVNLARALGGAGT
jgi:DNA polymerase-3 subunit delta